MPQEEVLHSWRVTMEGKLLNDAIEFVVLRLPLVIGGISQSVFLLLPVDLHNWDDDDINALTYVGIQMFMAGLIFVAVPMLLDIFALGWMRALGIILFVMLLAVLRAYRIIPLEFSFPVIGKSEPPRRIDFLEFNNAQRVRALSELNVNDPVQSRRFDSIRERLARKRSSRSLD
jgi:hypothetical protein